MKPSSNIPTLQPDSFNKLMIKTGEVVEALSFWYEIVHGLSYIIITVIVHENKWYIQLIVLVSCELRLMGPDGSQKYQIQSNCLVDPTVRDLKNII